MNADLLKILEVPRTNDWTGEESDKLIEGIRLYKKNYSKIEEYMQMTKNSA